MFRKLRRAAVYVAALGALALGGSAVAAATTTKTTTSTTATTSTTGTTSGATPPAGGSAGKSAPSMPAHGTASHEDAEKPVTGAEAAKVQAAAVKIVGSGTAGAVTTDYQGSGYETIVTKSDGSTVEVHLDSSLQEVAGPGSGGGPMGSMRAGSMRSSGMPAGAPPTSGYSG